jgi:hypothetical protein
MSENPMLGKIRKLLAMAERGATEAERNAFNAKAAELIAQYGIDAALLAQDQNTAPVVADKTIRVPAPYAMDKAVLLHEIALALGCKAIIVSSARRTAKGVRVHLFGFDSDLERLEILFTSLLVQAAFGLTTTRIPWGQNAAAYRRSWLSGFTSAIGYRLREAERRAKESAEDSRPGTALVLVRRTELVDRRFTELHPYTRMQSRTLSGSGAGDGYAAGKRADLGGSRVDQRERARIGG